MVVVGLGAADEGSGAAAVGARAKEGGHDADGIEIFGRCCAGEFGEGGHHVAAVAEMVCGGGLNFAGPPGDERHTNSAVCEIAFEAIERAIRIEEIVILRAFFVRAVVGSENHEGVAVDAEQFEFLQKAADVGVEAGDHRGVTFEGIFPWFIFVRTEVGNFHAVAERSFAFVVGVRDDRCVIEKEGSVVGVGGGFDEIEHFLGEKVAGEFGFVGGVTGAVLGHRNDAIAEADAIRCCARDSRENDCARGPG